jgi:hypothetical protein
MQKFFCQWYLDTSGTVLMEKKVILVVSAVMIFGMASMALPWIHSYFSDYTASVRNAGKVHEFRSVILQ